MLGIKHICKSCQTKFYNPSDDKVLCPACGMLISETNFEEKTLSIAIPVQSQNNDDYFSEDENLSGQEEIYKIAKEIDLN